MAITINGSGTITGISTGGLPDGIVDDGTLASSAVTSTKLASSAVTSTKLASSAVTSTKIADGTITNSDIKASAAITASKLSGTGKVLQVVSKQCTSNLSTTSTSLVASADSFLAITPSSASSKILIMSTQHIYVQGGAANNWIAAPSAIFRGTTQITESENYGVGIWKYDSADRVMMHSQLTRLDSPSTTSSVTYTVKFSNRNGFTTAVNHYGHGSITLMEIAQ